VHSYTFPVICSLTDVTTYSFQLVDICQKKDAPDQISLSAPVPGPSGLIVHLLNYCFGYSHTSVNKGKVKDIWDVH